MDVYREYVKGVSRSYYQEGSVEYSSRTELHMLIKDIIKKLDEKIEILQEIRVKEFGKRRADFILMKNGKVLGALETKRIGKNLDSKRYKKQIKDYSKELPLILTNYVSFRLIIAEESVFELDNILRYANMEDLHKDLTMLFERFLAFSENYE